MENSLFRRAITNILANCKEETPSSQREDATSHHLNSRMDFTSALPGLVLVLKYHKHS